MAGYLYYITTPFVSEEQLSEAQLKRVQRETNEQVQVMVLDDDITVVRADQEELEKHLPHHHVSTRRRVCPTCSERLAYDMQNVPTPE